MRRLAKLIAVSLFFLGGCSNEKFSEPPPRPCEFNEDCRDYIHCTVNICHDNVCVAWEDNDRCSRYHYCDARYDCRPLENPPPAECQASEDCFDDIFCTHDFCSGGTCINLPDDHNCPIDFLCDETRDCVYNQILGTDDSE